MCCRKNAMILVAVLVVSAVAYHMSNIIKGKSFITLYSPHLSSAKND